MKPPDNILFRSADGRFNLLISECLRNEMHTFCAAAHPLETGGILVGRYNCRHDTAIVTTVAGPPADSTSKRTRFYRGVHGLQSTLDASGTRENTIWANGITIPPARRILATLINARCAASPEMSSPNARNQF